MAKPDQWATNTRMDNEVTDYNSRSITYSVKSLFPSTDTFISLRVEVQRLRLMGEQPMATSLSAGAGVSFPNVDVRVFDSLKLLFEQQTGDEPL